MGDSAQWGRTCRQVYMGIIGPGSIRAPGGRYSLPVLFPFHGTLLAPSGLLGTLGGVIPAGRYVAWPTPGPMIKAANLEMEQRGKREIFCNSSGPRRIS